MKELQELKKYLYNFICAYELTEDNRNSLLETMLVFINEFGSYI